MATSAPSGSSYSQVSGVDDACLHAPYSAYEEIRWLGRLLTFHRDEMAGRGDFER